MIRLRALYVMNIWLSSWTQATPYFQGLALKLKVEACRNRSYQNNTKLMVFSNRLVRQNCFGWMFGGLYG
jgi:hypothetical protein